MTDVRIRVTGEDIEMLRTLSKVGKRSMKQTVSVLIQEAFDKADLELGDE